MIYVCMTGRLGNQMFQYAFAREISQLTGQKIVLNTYYLNKYTNYKFQLNIFRLINNNNIVIEENKPMPFFSNLMFYPTKILRKFFPRFYRKLVSCFGGIVDLSMEYHGYSLKHKNFYILGYFQSELYFKKIKNILISDFNLLNFSGCNKNVSNLLEEIKNTESVCISVRRGDYVHNKNIKDKFYVCNEAYFNKAVDLMIRKKPNCVLYVFSDDPSWVKENLLFPTKTYYEPIGLTIEEKILLMSACKNFILSNSSFSWRMQYLSKNTTNKIVIAPKDWFANGDKTSIYELQNFLYI